MIHETGTVVAVEADAVWVETLQQTTCGSCIAKAGCGQRLLTKMSGRKNRIRVVVPADYSPRPEPGQTVELGIPEDALVKGAVLVYLLPVLGLMGGGYIGAQLLQSDSWAALFGVAGLVLGGLLVRCHSRFNRNNKNYSPLLLANQNEQIVNFR